ncbi:MAG: response regulator [Bacteroidota bacterium]
MLDVLDSHGLASHRIRTCIIVDDERTARKALVIMLEEAFPDMKVIAEADSVDSAVECITRLKPDIVFLDIEIIGGTGFDVLKQIPSLKTVLVVLTTANQEYGQKIDEMNLLCLFKPVDVEMLRRVLN